MGFVGNLALFAAVKEFWKSTENWQSYSHGFGGTLFWLTVYCWNYRRWLDGIIFETQFMYVCACV